MQFRKRDSLRALKIIWTYSQSSPVHLFPVEVTGETIESDTWVIWVTKWPNNWCTGGTFKDLEVLAKWPEHNNRVRSSLSVEKIQTNEWYAVRIALRKDDGSVTMENT